MMNMLTFGVLCGILYVAAARSSNPLCTGDTTGLMKVAMVCMKSDISLMMQAAEMFENPNIMSDRKAMTAAFMKLACSNQHKVAEAIYCVVKKYAECLDGEARTFFNDFMPNTARLEDVLKLYCSHSEDIMKADGCLDKTDLFQIQQCMATSAAKMDTPITHEQMKASTCKIIKGVESCLAMVHGSCPDDIISLMTHMVDRLFPTSTCPKSNIKDVAMKNAMSSLLLHGQPLLFKPNNGQYMRDNFKRQIPMP